MKKKAVIMTLCALLCAGMLGGHAIMVKAVGPEPEMTPEALVEPASELQKDQRAEYIVTYALRSGDQGELSIPSASIAVNAAIGMENIPLLALPDGWELQAFVVADTLYTAGELAEYVPGEDLTVEVRTILTEKSAGHGPNRTIEDDKSGDEVFGETEPEAELPRQNYLNKNLITAMKSAIASLDDRIAFVADMLQITGDYVLEKGDDNVHEALAIYAIYHGQTENFPYDVKITNEKEAVEFRSIYWNLNMVNASKTVNGSVVRVTRLSGAEVFGLTGAQRTVFETLVTSDNQARIQALW